VGKRLTGERTPDYGPKRLHPTAGATIMGVRDPLIAFNLNLQPPDPAIAQQIARRIRREREQNPALRGVRALGLWLPSRQAAQVALNLTQTEQTDLFRVAETVRAMARALGAEIAETELVGVLSAEDAARALQSALRLQQLTATQIVPRE
ncbi:MAG: glutamate formiminotransferase, partial [bacterium]|nr:glutamate formiminotransferase [bacterium]